jgi:hypothetical protein
MHTGRTQVITVKEIIPIVLVIFVVFMFMEPDVQYTRKLSH